MTSPGDATATAEDVSSPRKNAMRILLVHCRYRQRGGEDAVFDTEAAQMEDAGHVVERFELSNDEIEVDGTLDKIRSGLNTVWSPTGAARLEGVLRQFRPDVAHFHNTFPILSPSAYYACKRQRVPVVQTLHNYRMLCANAMFIRAGQVCEDCSGGRYFNGFVHGCYRDSRLASAAVVAMQYVHHLGGTYRRRIDRLIALTEFARGKFLDAGFAPQQVLVKPNSLPTDPGPGDGHGSYALFVGRLSAEKGVTTLLDAWRRLPAQPLVIAGDGPLFDVVARTAREIGPHIRVLGAVDRHEVQRLMGEAAFLVVPSEWYEGFPMTVVEAYARGLPVLASNIGSLGEVVQDGRTGWHSPAADAAALADTVQRILAAPATVAAIRENCRAHFLSSFSAARNAAALAGIYRDMIGARRT